LGLGFDEEKAMMKTVPASTLAKLLMISTERVRQLAVDGILQREGRGNYELAPAVQAYLRYLREQTYGRDWIEREDEFLAEIRDLRAKLDRKAAG